MARDDSHEIDDQFAALLAEYHEGIVSGRGRPAGNRHDEELDPLLRSRLSEARQCLEVIEQFRLRDDLPIALEKFAGSPPEESSSDGGVAATEPRTFGRFQIVRELRRGGFGVVFLAHDPVLRRDVALKVPRPDALLTPDLRRRFLREAQAAARLTHPNLVAVHEVGEVGPICFIAAAYCDGPTLDAWLQERAEPAPPRLAAHIVAALADAVHYAHTQGVLHRDLKPSNVLLESSSPAAARPADDEPPFIPKLTDFGLAKLAECDAEETQTRRGTRLGTPGYMAPEQADGRLNEVGPRTDVYSLGALLYELLTAQPVFRGSTDLDTLHRVLVDEPIPPRRLQPDLPRDLEAICLMCLEKQPGRRYETSAALASDLRRFLAGEATEARPLSAAGKLWKWSRRRPAAAALVLVSTIAAMMIVGGSLWYSARLSTALVATESQRSIAVKAREESEQSRLATLAHEEVANQYLYASRMKLAFQSLAQADVQQTASLLAEYDGGSRFSHLRGFEWGHAKRALHEERLSLVAHRQTYGVAFSPDGRLLATGGQDGIVRFWDPMSGQELAQLPGHKSCVNQLSFSPDGNKLATSSCDGTVKIWDVATRAELLWSSRPEPSGQVLCLAFSPDGVQLAAGGSNRRTSILRVADGKELANLGMEHDAADALAWSPDGLMLAQADHHSDGRTNVSWWNTTTWTQLVNQRLSGSAVAFSPDSKTLAIGDFNGLVRLWDLTLNRELLALRGHTTGVYAVAFSPDGKSLASGGNDRTVRVWDQLKVRPVMNPTVNATKPDSHATARDPHRAAQVFVGHADRVQGLAFSCDGLSLASAGFDGATKIWDLASPGGGGPSVRFEKSFLPAPHVPVISPNLRHLIASDASGQLDVWDIANAQKTGNLDLPAKGNLFVLSTDGLALATNDRDTDLKIVLRKFPSLEPLCTVPSRGALLNTAVLSRDALVLATACGDGFIRVIELATNRQIHETQVIDANHPSAKDTMCNVVLALSHDARTLAIGSVDHGRVLIDLMTLQVRPLPVDDRRITHMEFSRDNRLLAVASDNSTIRLVDRASGDLVRMMRPPAPVKAMTLSPDARTLATAIAGGAVALWHTATGQQVVAFDNFPGEAIAIRFSHDGNALAAVVDVPEQTTSEIHVWSTETK